MYLMNKDKKILEFETIGNSIQYVKLINADIAPEMVKSGLVGALERWLIERSIDTTRFNANLLLNKMNVSNSPIEITMANKAINLTDTYWIKTENKEEYKDISLLRKNTYKDIVEISLFGKTHDVSMAINTELTNIGSYEKAWIKKGLLWYLVKKGNDKSIYSELFAYYLGDVVLGMDMAEYFMKDNMIWSRNFTTEDVILEHYASLKYKFNDMDIDDRIIYENLLSINKGDKYLDMLFLDAIINNVDRHEFNFGILKDALTGAIIDVAPNYDNNLSFGGVSLPSSVQLKMLLKDFDLRDRVRDFLHKVDLNIIKEIDNKIRKEVDPKDLSPEKIMEYFRNIVKILEENK